MTRSPEMMVQARERLREIAQMFTGKQISDDDLNEVLGVLNLMAALQDEA